MPKDSQTEAPENLACTNRNDAGEAMQGHDAPPAFAPWPVYSEAEIQAVAEVLRSGRVNYWTGEHGRAFESEFAEWVGVPYAIALSSGTVALEIALLAMELAPDDEVIVPARTFVATASAVVRSGARPVFADVDVHSQNLCAATIEPKLTRKTRAIICVHVGGIPCDMAPILALARSRGIAVIEDCAQAHGAIYRDQPVGSLGDIAAWSFCQDKIISTGGEGGMITTNSRQLWERAWALKDHGTSPHCLDTRRQNAGFTWQRSRIGTNGRMTEMQAAIGRLQLRQLPRWRQIRQANAKRIDQVAMHFPHAVRTARVPANSQSAEYKHYLFVQPRGLRSGWTRDRIQQALVNRGVPCFHGICPEVYLEEAFAAKNVRPMQRLPVAKALGETSLMLLVHPTLTEDNLKHTEETLYDVLSEASL